MTAMLCTVEPGLQVRKGEKAQSQHDGQLMIDEAWHRWNCMDDDARPRLMRASGDWEARRELSEVVRVSAGLGGRAA